MFIETAKLIEQTIRDLEMTLRNLGDLAELLGEEMDEAMHHPTEVSADLEKCEEAQLAIDALIPKLRAAHPAYAPAMLRALSKSGG
jgi:hypothetical protein